MIKVVSVLSCVAVAALAGSASAAVVFSNNAAPGDAFTFASTPGTGQAVSGSGWHYNNVRTNGIVGVNSTNPRSGNGSVYFNLSGAGNSKADIEFFASATADGNGNFNPTSAIGVLGALNSLKYDWYRDSSSAAAAQLHPVIRLQVVNPANTAEFGYLVFEREVNRNDFGFPPAVVAPTDTWVTEDVFGGNYRLWSTGGTLPNNLNGTNGPARYYDANRLDYWMSNYGSYAIVGVSVGVGSGWGTFTGAADNVMFGFTGGQAYNFNFEVVPAPASAGLLGLAGLAAARRRRR
jgi:hypothetical protein